LHNPNFNRFLTDPPLWRTHRRMDGRTGWWWWWWFEKLCSPAFAARNSHERASDTRW